MWNHNTHVFVEDVLEPPVGCAAEGVRCGAAHAAIREVINRICARKINSFAGLELKKERKTDIREHGGKPRRTRTQTQYLR